MSNIDLQLFSGDRVPRVKPGVPYDRALYSQGFIHGGEPQTTGAVIRCFSPTLPLSKSSKELRNQAVLRLRVMQRKFEMDHNLRDWYEGKIDEYIEKGYAYKMTRQDWPARGVLFSTYLTSSLPTVKVKDGSSLTRPRNQRGCRQIAIC